MRIRVIACEVFTREVSRLLAESPNTCDVEYLPKGLHDLGATRMRARLQERVDAVPHGIYDALVLAYGLCNNGLAGITARNTRLVLPRAHDCMTLFLGSRGRYQEEFNAHPGTYYRTTGWYEREDPSGAGEATIPQQLGLRMGFEELVEKYGEENARFIREQLGDETRHYTDLCYIRMGLECEADFVGRARGEAAARGWNCRVIDGDLGLLRRLLNGPWDGDFLVLGPGQSVGASYGDGIVLSADAKEEALPGGAASLP